MIVFSRRLLSRIVLALLVAGQLSPALAQRSSRIPRASRVLERNIRAELGFLASDAMQGRKSASGFERIAAEYIGSQFRQFGLEAAGDEESPGKRGFVQQVRLDNGSTWNAVGVLHGSDPAAAKDAIMLSAHLDHLGVGEGASGDNIFNGADDDASGCVAVMELARFLTSGPRPKRTIYFVCFGSEETGGFGARYFVANSPVPLKRIVADITFEMLGRPDAKVASGSLWLTGYERSNLGVQLARHGARLVHDPHPEENFFQRSDNYTLALRGVVAHTVSSFGLHSDYHQPGDEISKIDFPFMTRAISSMAAPIRWLANSSFRPTWQPGQAPTR